MNISTVDVRLLDEILEKLKSKGAVKWIIDIGQSEKEKAEGVGQSVVCWIDVNDRAVSFEPLHRMEWNLYCSRRCLDRDCGDSKIICYVRDCPERSV